MAQRKNAHKIPSPWSRFSVHWVRDRQLRPGPCQRGGVPLGDFSASPEQRASSPVRASGLPQVQLQGPPWLAVRVEAVRRHLPSGLEDLAHLDLPRAGARVQRRGLDGFLELSLTELSGRTGAPHPSVYREVKRGEAAGLLVSRKVGNTRLVRANTASPYYAGLSDVLTKGLWRSRAPRQCSPGCDGDRRRLHLRVLGRPVRRRGR
jgi:hypothetical protein